MGLDRYGGGGLQIDDQPPPMDWREDWDRGDAALATVREHLKLALNLMTRATTATAAAAEQVGHLSSPINNDDLAERYALVDQLTAGMAPPRRLSVLPPSSRAGIYRLLRVRVPGPCLHDCRGSVLLQSNAYLLRGQRSAATRTVPLRHLTRSGGQIQSVSPASGDIGVHQFSLRHPLLNSRRRAAQCIAGTVGVDLGVTRLAATLSTGIDASYPNPRHLAVARAISSWLALLKVALVRIPTTSRTEDTAVTRRSARERDMVTRSRRRCSSIRPGSPMISTSRKQSRKIG